MAALPTAEICDTNPILLASNDLRILNPVFQIYGQSRAFSGPIVSVKVFEEDNVLVRDLVETKGEGRILVVGGGGSMRCALLGGNLVQLAQTIGWAGILVNMCVRDVDEINVCRIGVRPLGSYPLRSNKNIGGTFIRDGEWLYADNYGILVSKFELSYYW